MNEIGAYIYMIIINGTIWPEYGYFYCFDLARNKAAGIAVEYGGKAVENSWKSDQLFIVGDRTIGVIKIDHSSVAEM